MAADVLGKLTVEQTPAALRPFAHFTAAKRVRFGAVALAAELDADEQFRGRVADLVAQTSPRLADAVRGGSATSASDPVDVEVVAYLLRPAGWQELITECAARSSPSADPRELARLREQVAQLKSQSRSQTARAKQAARAAGAQRSAEFTEAQDRLRARTAQLRAAEQAAEQACSRADAAERDVLAAQAANAAQETELRRLRGRIAELERTVENARRVARAEREIDDARLWLLIDTMTRAAAGVRRELSLPAPTSRPADLVASAAVGDMARSVDDAGFLDRLLALPNAHLVVDGYNVTKTGYGELPLADQRKRLIASLAALAGQRRAEVTVVFDGSARPPVMPAAPRGIRVLFSAPTEIADDVIRRVVAGEPVGRPVLVATSDRQVQRDIQRDGGWVVPSRVLLDRLG
ncbi:MAG: NYN domain-containing protein [Actinomycetia bacterium]|nr:NYN domain-containing protein [Actinomycetes bacterium]